MLKPSLNMFSVHLVASALLVNYPNIFYLSVSVILNNP